MEETNRLSKELQPSDALRQRTIASLRESNLIPRRRQPWLLVAAALIAGFLIPRPHFTKQQREFMLFVHDTPVMLNDGKEPQRIKEYSAWARSLRERGQLEGGEKLKDEISTIGANPGSSDVGGFFRIVARDREEANAIARTCPHVRYGGWIEVREIDRI